MLNACRCSSLCKESIKNHSLISFRVTAFYNMYHPLFPSSLSVSPDCSPQSTHWQPSSFVCLLMLNLLQPRRVFHRNNLVAAVAMPMGVKGQKLQEVLMPSLHTIEYLLRHQTPLGQMKPTLEYYLAGLVKVVRKMPHLPKNLSENSTTKLERWQQLGDSLLNQKAIKVEM